MLCIVDFSLLSISQLIIVTYFLLMKEEQFLNFFDEFVKISAELFQEPGLC